MIIGAHSIIYSLRPEADRAFLRRILKLPSVDAGGGWLIFGLPPAEVAVHPSNENDVHELYLMADDVEAFVAAMNKRGIACGPVQDRGWGLLAQLTLPGGGKLGVYQPRHARPQPMKIGRSTRKVATQTRAAKSTKKARQKPARKKARRG